MTPFVQIGKRIRQRREELGIAPLDLAEACGVAQSTIYRWQNGEVIPADGLLRLVGVLKVSADWLLFGKEASGKGAPIVYPPDLTRLISKVRTLPEADRAAVETIVDRLLESVAAEKPSRKRRPA